MGTCNTCAGLVFEKSQTKMFMLIIPEKCWDKNEMVLADTHTHRNPQVWDL